MEQTKNEPTKENKAAPDTGKPKKGREPLTEAQRLKRQKMIVLPAMVLVFIGAMWLIFAPSSGKEQQPGTDGYNTEMPDADKANRQIIGDKLKAYEHGEMEERLESRNRAIGQLGDMFDREIAGTEDSFQDAVSIRPASPSTWERLPDTSTSSGLPFPMTASAEDLGVWRPGTALSNATSGARRKSPGSRLSRGTSAMWGRPTPS